MKLKNKLKTLVVAGFAIFMLAQISGIAEAAEKVGYVNLAAVFDSYKQTKAYDTDLEAKAESKRTEREALVSEIKRLRDEVELLSEEKRVQKQMQIDEKVKELQAFDRDARQGLRQERDTMLREILKKIDEVVKEFGKAEGYEYIFNDRALIYKNEANDLSDQIIQRLNAKD